MADQEAKIDLGITGLGPAEHIGRGGFADVYRAEQLSLRRTVAVKVLRAQASDPESEARFERECHAIGAVSDHPHIVGVHEGGFTRNGRAYLVMEYLPGGSLYERLKEFGPMPVAEIVDTGIKIGKALAVAHRTGVLHRDIKPANIMISAYGEPALGDFGIARIEGGHQTATGLVTASFAHAAPEVLEGQAPTAGADIYSLGTTIFELMTGKPPYFDPADESIWPLMKRILSEPMPSPESVGMSPQLGRVFERATARNAGDRYIDAEELVEDLLAVASDPLAVALYPPSGSDVDPTATLDEEVGRLVDPHNGTGPRTLVGGTPIDPGFPPGIRPAAKPDLTSVRQPETEILPGDFAPATGFGSEPPMSSAPATTMDLPPTMPTVSTRSSRSSGARLAVLAGIGVTVLAAAVAGALYWNGRGGGVATVPSSQFQAVISGPSQAPVDGPLRVGEGYLVDVPGVGGERTLQLVIDGQPVGPATGDAAVFEASAGRHTVAVEITVDGATETTDGIAVYGLGGTTAAGYRANLASIHVEDQGWAATLEVFDRLVADGHEALEIIATDEFETLTSGYWTLYVPGFGEDGAAAEAYCLRFELAIPLSCYAGYLDPSLP